MAHVWMPEGTFVHRTDERVLTTVLTMIAIPVNYALVCGRTD